MKHPPFSPATSRPLRLLAGLALAGSLPTATAALPAPAAAALAVHVEDAQAECQADIEFALDALEEQCGHFFELKDIDWKAVRREFTKAAKQVETPEQHHLLLWRLLARLRDGHARVMQPEGQQIAVAGRSDEERVGPGLFLTRVGKRVYVKQSYSSAREVGIEPGYEVLSIDGEKPLAWLAERQAKAADELSFSTEQHAFFYTTHWGLGDVAGTRLKLEVKDEKGKKKKKTITYTDGRLYLDGPAHLPTGLNSTQDLKYGRTARGHGYIHVRRCKGDLPEQMDEALAAIGEVPGLILDFRANSGGGFDHDALLGRFVPQGQTMSFTKSIPSAGPQPYGGPLVVIVDGTVVSAGETGSGMFKEDGRAYMIGESPTAGMSSSKTTVELPSGKFALYVSIASNKSRFQQGRGIEGIGIEPHEIVEYEPKELLMGIDTQIRRAQDLLESFPQKEVPYDPADFGWQG